METTENKEICSICGGKCCKKSGCDYSTEDFEDLSINYSHSLLLEGDISIVSSLSVERLPNNNLCIIPFLYLRTRNINRPIVDLLSMKTTCSQLLEDGCKYGYNERPSGGKNLIPNSDFNCYPNQEPYSIVESWKNYQKILSRLVKRITGMSVDERLRLDVQNLFIDIINKNFENVSKIEIEDIARMLPLLTSVYPQEYLNAKNKYDKLQKVKSKTKETHL